MTGGFRARLRRWYWLYLRNYQGETCEDCERPYRSTVWRANDKDYELVTGWGGRGLLCPSCFGKRAKSKGLRVTWRPLLTGRR